MTVLEYILDGIEAELVLERELGVRSVECDRGLLDELSAAAATSPSVAPVSTASPTSTVPRSSPASSLPPTSPAAPAATPTLIFLHDGPLSAEGVTMMSKIYERLHLTLDDVPIVTQSETLPESRVYVVLGSKARDRWFPGLRSAPGKWVEWNGLTNIHVTYSPEYILKQDPSMPGMEKIKRMLWDGIKGAVQRRALA